MHILSPCVCFDNENLQLILNLIYDKLLVIGVYHYPSPRVCHRRAA